jgi:hypothetical protein
MYIECCGHAVASKLLYRLCRAVSECASVHIVNPEWIGRCAMRCDRVAGRHIWLSDMMGISARLHLVRHESAFDLAGLVLTHFRLPVLLLHECA